VIIYIHGLNSSALSFKASVLRRRMTELRRGREFLCPELPPSPREAIALLAGAIEEHAPAETSLIGSSLGGYYATCLAERYGLRAVLINPAVAPYELLASALGPQVNLYTGARYELTHAHVDELRALEVERVTPERYLLILGTADEVLDYRTAVAKYRGARQIVVEGGDHGLSNFEPYLDPALAFCGLARR
jgi:predicted esterase YcpF (UPF0227 family)